MTATISDITNGNDLENFAEKLLQEKGTVGIDPEVREQMKNDLVERLEERVNAVILEQMPPEKLEEFEKLLDEAESDEISRFCSANIADLDQILAAELVSFRTTYLMTG